MHSMNKTAENSSIFASVVLSRVSILRNLENYAFSLTLSQEKKSEIETKVLDFLSSNNNKIKVCDFKGNSKNSRQDFAEELLFEKNSKKQGKLVLLKNQNILILLNNDDHINITTITNRNFNIDEAYKKAESLERQLSENFNFSASTKYGYLTSLIKNCGLGIKLSVLVHIPGIVLLKKQNETFSALLDKGINVKPLQQYKVDENETNYYILSSSLNFGLTESDLISRFVSDVEDLLSLNHSYLVEFSLKNKAEFVDNIYRSYGTLKYAKLMDIQEAVYHLSNLRMGINLGEDIPVSIETINKIFVLLQEDFINEAVETEKKQSDAIIAELIKSHLNSEKNDVS